LPRLGPLNRTLASRRGTVAEVHNDHRHPIEKPSAKAVVVSHDDSNFVFDLAARIVGAAGGITRYMIGPRGANLAVMGVQTPRGPRYVIAHVGARMREGDADQHPALCCISLLI